MGGIPLQIINDCLYLGVNISHDLNWKNHISHITKKASQTVGFLRRNLRNCPINCRKLAYISLVRSKLDYAATVWDPFSISDIDRLERVQKRAARFITNDYKNREPGCVTRMLQKLNLPSLQHRRQQQRLKLLYKINANQLPAIPPMNFLTPANQGKRKIKLKTNQDFQETNILQRQAFNNTMAFYIPPCINEKYRNSFFIRTLYDWNALSDSDINTELASAAPSAQKTSSVAGTC